MVMNLNAKDMPNYIILARTQADCVELVEASDGLVSGCAWQSGLVSLRGMTLDSAALTQRPDVVDPLEGLDPATLTRVRFPLLYISPSHTLRARRRRLCPSLYRLAAFPSLRRMFRLR